MGGNLPWLPSNVTSNIIDIERSIFGQVLGWVRLIASGIAVIMITYQAFYYMKTDAHGRAERKENFVNFCIGAFFVIGASNIIYYLEGLVEYIIYGAISS